MGRQILFASQELLSRFRYAEKKERPNTFKTRIAENLDAEVYPDLYDGISANELNNIEKYKMFENSFSRIISKYDESSDLSVGGYDLNEVLEYKNKRVNN